MARPDDSPTPEAFPQAAAVPGGTEAPDRPLPKSLDDARVGPYHLLRILGEGGFGVVYLAERREPFVQQMALKVLRPGMDSEAIVRRFELERQALALMDHPGIAKVLDGGVTDEGSRLGAGRPYFVMELVRGEPISEYCRNRGLTIPQRVELFLAVCDAVQHAHTKGVIHRDLKPSNILVTRAEGSGGAGSSVPKVIDFGIAKAVTGAGPSQPAMTMTGQFVGTPEYMSPEQAAGTGGGAESGGDVDTRSDVYSLGVVLYKLLTGLLPFEPDQLWRAGLLETMRVIREVEPPKPSTRVASVGRTRTGATPASESAALTAEAPDVLSKRLRGDLDWICMRALEKTRERRYQSPGALAEDLRRFLRTEPVEAGPPTTAYRARKFIRRHRVLVAAASVTALALVIGLIMALVSADVARRQRDVANEATKLAERKTAEAEVNLAAALRQQRAAEAALGYTRRAAQLARPLSDEEFTVRQLLDQMHKEVTQEREGVDADVRIQTLSFLGDLYRTLGELGMAERSLVAAMAEAERAGGGGATGDVRRAWVGQLLARVHNDQNRFQDGLKLAEEAAAIARGATSPDAPLLLVRALATAGVSCQKLNRRDEAIRLLREAIAAGQARLGEGSPELINPLSALALLQVERPETRREGLETAERCLELIGQSASQGDENRLLGQAALNTVGRAKRELGDLAGAATAYRGALAISDEIPGIPPLTTASTQINLALVLRELGETAEARELAGKSAATRRVLLPGTPDLADALDVMAGLEADAENLAAAEELYREELEILAQPDIGSDLSAARARTGLADVLVRTERFEPAARVAELALKARRNGLSASDWRIFSTQSVLGAAKAGLGEFEPAEKLLLEAVERLKADPATTAARLRPVLRRTAQLYERWGRAAELARWQREFDSVDPRSK